MVSQRTTKRELKQPDSFQSFAVKLIEQIKAHRHEALLVVAAAVVLIVIIAVVVGVSSRREKEARRNFSAIDEQYREFIESRQKPSTPLTPASAKSSDDTKEATAIIAAFEKFIGDYGSSDAAALANFYLAELNFAEKQYAKAYLSYKKYLATLPGSSFYRAIVLSNMGYALEAQNKFAAAATDFLQAAAIEENPLRDHAYNNAARMFEAAAKPQEAKRYYQLLVKDYPDSSWQDFAKQRLNELQVAVD